MKEEWKVYVKGVDGRGEEIIKALEDLGAVNHWNYTGDRTTGVYYITHDGYIGVVGKDVEFTQIIMDNYREIKLPKKWKDGDILFSETDNEFAVFKCEYKINSINTNKFISYLATCFGGCLIHQTILRKDFRLATKSEVAQFHERLHAIEKDWDAEKKQLVDWRWRPEMNQKFYYIDIDGRVSIAVHDSSKDSIMFCINNCFKTLEEAEAMAEKVRKLLKGEL